MTLQRRSGKWLSKCHQRMLGLHRGETDVPWNSDRRSITQQIEKLDLIDWSIKRPCQVSPSVDKWVVAGLNRWLTIAQRATGLSNCHQRCWVYICGGKMTYQVTMIDERSAIKSRNSNLIDGSIKHQRQLSSSVRKLDCGRVINPWRRWSKDDR